MGCRKSPEFKLYGRTPDTLESIRQGRSTAAWKAIASKGAAAKVDWNFCCEKGGWIVPLSNDGWRANPPLSSTYTPGLKNLQGKKMSLRRPRKPGPDYPCYEENR
jgi:hypothetical protein